MLEKVSYFSPRLTLHVERLELITQLKHPKMSHLQILYCKENHWVCCFYDGKSVYIYDSLEWSRKKNRFSLHSSISDFLKAVFPFYNLRHVKVPNVQNQRNSYDCRVCAIAFAISILFGLQPEKVYNDSMMRIHLLKMLDNRKIEHFPIDSGVLPPLVFF